MKIETLIGKLMIKTKEVGTRKTHKVLTDKLFYKSGKGWWFNVMNIKQLSKDDIKKLLNKL